MRHWLIKSEPEVFGIDDLAKVKREPWSGGGRCLWLESL